MNAITVFIVVIFALIGGVVTAQGRPAVAIAFWIVGAGVSQSLKLANTWQKFVVLRAGQLQGVRGPGIFFIIPIWDRVIAVIDERVQTTAFNAEQALTRDTVPVNVDAIIFWRVHDAKKAALSITDYQQAISRVAQTSLRAMIGSAMLATLLSDRRAADIELCTNIGQKAFEWGVTVQSVEIRDVAIPVALQDAMSRQAQAEREKQARVILGSAEEEIASKFVNAARIYANHPLAMQLRAMNIIYETTKERGTTILIPSSLVDSLNPGSPSVMPTGTSVEKESSFLHPDGLSASPLRSQARVKTARTDSDTPQSDEWELSRALNDLVSEGGYALASDDSHTEPPITLGKLK